VERRWHKPAKERHGAKSKEEEKEELKNIINI
jgi:hypothetical protein